METYIALLRGVNVGGQNKVPMPLLKAALVEAGFSNVRTYINSGNVIFGSEEQTIEILQQLCRQLILDAFGLDIPVAVLPATELAAALAHAPAWWGCSAQAKHNAIFIIAPAKADDIFATVGQVKPEYEQVAHYKSVIFWTAPIETFSRTRWSKVASTAAYGSITIRNANTTKKLVALATADMPRA